MPAELLVPELGLKNTRRNRRWLAILRALERLGGSQEENEAAAWAAIKAYEETK